MVPPAFHPSFAHSYTIIIVLLAPLPPFLLLSCISTLIVQLLFPSRIPSSSPFPPPSSESFLFHPSPILPLDLLSSFQRISRQSEKRDSIAK